MKQSFYSNGKLLITGEYLVLDGAKALAIPTKFGQYLKVNPTVKQSIQWKSLDSDHQIWFEDEIFWNEIVNLELNDQSSETKSTLVKILHVAYHASPNRFDLSTGFEVSTELTFPKSWGLGTSSTLINNIAKWFQIDAFDLLQKSFGGSGYDIACAENKKPIVYQRLNEKPFFKLIDFYPNFHENIYFVYLNKKQNSRAAITSYYNKRQNVSDQIVRINEITEGLIACKQLQVFQQLLREHETVMSVILEMKTVQETFFSDFDGVVKSLGAWGGDFVMVVSNNDPRDYFEEKDFNTIINYQDMIL